MGGVLEPKQNREQEPVAKELGPEVESQPGMSNSGAAARAMAARRERAEQAALASPSANYEQLLGKTLGPALYNAVSDLVTLDALAGYARSGLQSGLGSLGRLVRDSDLDPAQAGEYEEAIDALQLTLGPLAEQFVKEHGQELQERLQNFVDTRPVAVIALSLLAAAAAIAADMEIPELKATFHITDELDISAGARLGTLRNVAVERISARVAYHGAVLRASAEGSYDFKEDQGSVEADLGLKINEDVDIYGHGRFNTTNESGRVEIQDHSVRGGVRWRPREDMSVEGYGEHSSERGTSVGVNFRWLF